ncbi:MAG: hypothetical protein IPN26_14490 [Bacteroidetes bacterium]|nr:hypothetical protein [Bacteroidota bacterium]
MSANKIGDVLGLDIQKDPAEKEILLKAIQDLKDDKMLEGDESIMWLSDTGIDYAKMALNSQPLQETLSCTLI